MVSRFQTVHVDVVKTSSFQNTLVEKEAAVSP